MDKRKSKDKNRKNKAKSFDKIIKVLTAACVIVAVVLIAIVAVSSNGSYNIGVVSGADGNSASEAETTDSREETSESDTSTTVEQITQSVTETSEETSGTDLTVEADKPEKSTESTDSGRIIVDPEQELWNLVVVNSGREMPEGYVPQLEYVAGSDYEMDYRVAPWYDKMYYAALEDGITLTPYSGYRSYERQKINYENLTETYMYDYDLTREEAEAEAARVILPPGTSEHNLGLAMDICNTYDSFVYQEEYEWLTEHAHEYGFILRYTAEKEHITGIVDEPWHWRYVGVEYAEKIKNSGLCLEEYLDSVGIPY